MIDVFFFGGGGEVLSFWAGEMGSLYNIAKGKRVEILWTIVNDCDCDCERFPTNHKVWGMKTKTSGKEMSISQMQIKAL